MGEQEEHLVQTTMAPLAGMTIPPKLTASIRRYQCDLTLFAAALLEGGHEEEVVRRSVETVFESYRDDLVRSIIELREGPDHG